MSTHIVLPSALNVRAAPRATEDSTILGVLSFGTVIEALDANADRSWLRVRVGTLEGWVSNKYLLRDEAHQAYPWMAHAIHEFGVTEIPGTLINRRIEAYFSTAGAPDANDDTTAWCSAFAKWCVIQARATDSSLPDVKKINLSARSWHKHHWGQDVTKTAPLGSVAVLWRRRSATENGATHADRTGTPSEVLAQGTGGHVGFLAEPFQVGDTSIVLFGGNQSNQVCKAKYSLGKNYGLLSFRGVD